jgi:AraC-like DNA-binding protein
MLRQLMGQQGMGTAGHFFVRNFRSRVTVLTPSLFISVFILPIVGPFAAMLLLLAAGVRRQFAPALLALLALVPAFVLAQGLLSAVGWCLLPLAAAPTAPAHLPWYAELLLAPICYLYLRVLGQEALRQPGNWRHLLPGLGQVGLFAGITLLGFAYRQVSRPGGGPSSAALGLLRQVVPPLALLCYGLLLHFGWRALAGARRHAQPARRAPFTMAGQPLSTNSLVFLVVLGFGLGLVFVAVEVWFGPFPYADLWFAFAIRAGIVFGLAVVGVQTLSTLPEQEASADAYQLQYLRSINWASPARLAVQGSEPPAPEPLPLVANKLLGGVLAAAPIRVELLPTLAATLVPWHTRLLTLMEEQRPWLEPELTLPQLAQRLGIHANVLSRIINTGCGQNFNDFVNSYRVAEARRLLADPQFAHYSLVGVALASGFNSKSTFNRVFKKLTEQVPGEVGRPNV